MKELPYLQVIVIEALQRAYRVHQDLGATTRLLINSL